MYKTISEVTDAAWDDFVDHHPNGNIYQHSSMFNVYQNTQMYRPVRVALVKKETNIIVGVMMGVIIKEMSNVLSRFSSRAIVVGGPLVSSDVPSGGVNILITAFDNEVKQAALYTEIRNLFDTKTIMQDIIGYSFVEHLNFHINLNRSEDEAWKSIHKDRRKNINRSEKYGLVVDEMKDETQMDVFYSLLKSTYVNAKVPLADRTLFEAAMKTLVPEGSAKFYLAQHDGRYVGARVILIHKKTIYDWYAGASREDLSLYPNEFLVWHILKWGVENNYSVFDFGGAGDPKKPYGPREFKRRFGGDLVNFGRFIKIHNPFMLKIAQYGFGLYRKIAYRN